MSEDLPGGSMLLPGYAGHADARARRLSDQQVRAWAGEVLADLRARLPSDVAADRLDALLLRAEFGDQHVIRAIDDERFGAPDLAELIEACDRRLVEAANLLREAGPDAPEAALEPLERAFDERSALMAERLKRSG